MSGEDTEPGATVFNVFAATYTKVHSPLFKPITVEADLAAHTARFFVDGVVDARIAPIRNPVTGSPHTPASCCRTVSSTRRPKSAAAACARWPRRSSSSGRGKHGHIARLDMTGKGLVRGRAA
jgi:hypothetical protein